MSGDFKGANDMPSALAVTPVGPDSLDPAVRQYIEHVRSQSRDRSRRDLPIETARDIVDTQLIETNPEQDIDEVADHSIEAGDRTVPIRVYGTGGENTPVVVFAHGGGWTFGNLDTHDGLCRQIATRTGATVVAVDYRLAPEYPYPAAVDDIALVLDWIGSEGVSIGVDASAVALVGENAGATLVTQCLLERHVAVPVACLGLIYPAFDPGCDTLSFRLHGTGLLIEAADIEWCWRQYCPDEQVRAEISTAPTADLDPAALVPMLVQTAGCDVLRDEGEQFAQRVAALGVPVKASRYESMIHGFYGLPHVVPGFRALALAELTRFLSRSLRRAR